MSELLLNMARRYGESHADKFGVAKTPIPGLSVIRITGPRELQASIHRPGICLVLQGKMEVSSGHCSVEAGPGEMLLLANDVPTINRISRASLVEPYVALIIDLDVAVITTLAADMDAVVFANPRHERMGNTVEEVASAALRLLSLVRRPESMSLLMGPLIRELHYWLLAGEHGPAIKTLGTQDSAARRVARTVATIRADFAKSLPVEQLALMAGMSVSAFHQHFRAATSMTPLQFQKQLRLIEARRLMLSEGLTASSAAYAVGYQSVSQFNRDYRRMFGLPPVRETSVARKAAGQVPVDWSHFRRDAMAGVTASVA